MTKRVKPVISIIIRTKNEEKWIGRCLTAVFNQKVDAEVEVVLVDNESTDHTVSVANRYPISKFVQTKDYMPGKALNDGIKTSTGDFIVCLSAHCVPENDNWLNQLLINFESELKIAGVYGRQLPLRYTDPIDKRDLLTVFGLDKIVQVKDYFFHNANSMIPRAVWNEYPFDEELTNIEDRVWGKEVIKAGFNLIYEPDAAVYHHHGLHQGNTRERVKGVVSILESVDLKDQKGLPLSMSPLKQNIAAVIPIMGNMVQDSREFKLLRKVVDQLRKSQYISSIYCISDDPQISKVNKTTWIDRRAIDSADSISLNNLLKQALNAIETKNDYPDSILYVNFDYLNRPIGIFDELITDAQYKGCDTVFPGLIDYGHYWFHNTDDEYEQTDPSLRPREKRDPLYKALYGLGCLTASWVIRSGQLVGGKVGILKVSNPKSAHREFRK
jgi:rhamnosyltransferase